jgi:protein-S-isoprenylcysteine O-methyltransferase Ste14
MLSDDYGDGEAPRADALQGMLAAFFFLVWLADSFWLHWTTHYFQGISGVIRSTLFLLFTMVGVYLTWTSHKIMFGTPRGEPTLVDYGVFRISRHPMYLGIMMIYLGLTLSTMSVVALAVLVMIFFFYNYLAAYEETQLIRFFGERYLGYMEKTRRWL